MNTDLTAICNTYVKRTAKRNIVDRPEPSGTGAERDRVDRRAETSLRSLETFLKTAEITDSGVRALFAVTSEDVEVNHRFTNSGSDL